ncbi:MAG: hypothetical protein HWE16_06260 [Gammaproteobacteria bacterium]|nr:hypothetical protein [Gammaproteobacteria bacterium]
MLKKLIPRVVFYKNYKLDCIGKYDQFIAFVAQKINDSIDTETKINSVTIENNWKDQGRNTHVSLYGTVHRRDEESEIRGEIVWLKNLNRFRGFVSSSLEPKSDKELFLEAKSLFHNGKYNEFLKITQYIKSNISNNSIFMKMESIAKKRLS